jgi:glutamate dehydrogenase (NAD(P)+)
MLWMLDEYEAITGGRYPGVITGKPVGMGGSLGRTEATGFGVIYVLREALKKLDIDIAGTSASFQGYGNVSQYAVQLYCRLGGIVRAISCWDNIDCKAYTFFKKDGIDCGQLSTITDTYGTMTSKGKGSGYEYFPRRLDRAE